MPNAETTAPETELLCWIQVSQQCEVTGASCGKGCSCLGDYALLDEHKPDVEYYAPCGQILFGGFSVSASRSPLRGSL